MKIKYRCLFGLFIAIFGFSACKVYRSDYCIPDSINLDQSVNCSCGKSNKECFMDFRIVYAEDGAIQTIRFITKECQFYIYQTSGTKIVEIYKQCQNGYLLCTIHDDRLLKKDVNDTTSLYIQLIRQNIHEKNLSYLLLNNKKVIGDYETGQ